MYGIWRCHWSGGLVLIVRIVLRVHTGRRIVSLVLVIGQIAHRWFHTWFLAIQGRGCRWCVRDDQIGVSTWYRQRRAVGHGRWTRYRCSSLSEGHVIGGDTPGTYWTASIGTWAAWYGWMKRSFDVRSTQANLPFKHILHSDHRSWTRRAHMSVTSYDDRSNQLEPTYQVWALHRSVGPDVNIDEQACALR